MKPGIWELAIILVIVIIIFGVGKLPELGGALGKGIREFRQATKTAEDATEEVKQAVDEAKEEAEKEA
ncbi:MAG: twin-arginine translocase TatA/TatE family subunit [Chloroflexi bacterium]|nr:twin-arginine translocase TatA/TatE family subunit [Chloroflexota bacterium]